MKWRIALALGLIALAGCAAAAIPLLHVQPADFGDPRILEQRLQLVRHGRSLAFDAVAAVSPTHIQLVATTFGVRLYDVTYDGRTVIVGGRQSSVDHFPPIAAVDDFLLIFSPDRVLRAALPRDLRLESDTSGRKLYRGARLLAAITYSGPDPANGRSHLHNAALGYDLYVDSRVVQ